MGRLIRILPCCERIPLVPGAREASRKVRETPSDELVEDEEVEFGSQVTRVEQKDS